MNETTSIRMKQRRWKMSMYYIEFELANRLNTRRGDRPQKHSKKYELIYLFPECGKMKWEQHNEITILYIWALLLVLCCRCRCHCCCCFWCMCMRVVYNVKSLTCSANLGCCGFMLNKKSNSSVHSLFFLLHHHHGKVLFPLSRSWIQLPLNKIDATKEREQQYRRRNKEHK